MTWFLLGMLVMWFIYPLLKATQSTMVMKWTNLTINKEEIDENTTIGFKVGGQDMESLVSAIVWFGNTVVICILACVVYCMFSNERSK